MYISNYLMVLVFKCSKSVQLLRKSQIGEAIMKPWNPTVNIIGIKNYPRLSNPEVVYFPACSHFCTLNSVHYDMDWIDVTGHSGLQL